MGSQTKTEGASSGGVMRPLCGENVGGEKDNHRSSPDKGRDRAAFQ